MHKLSAVVATFFAAIAVAPGAAAQTSVAVDAAVRAASPVRAAATIHPHAEYLVSTAWLARHLQSPGVVVVQVGRGDAAYLAGHIPGARFLPLDAVAATVGAVPNEFPPEADLVRTFRDLGVGGATRIVLYGDDAGLLAARAWVALDLLGRADRAALLDGGLAKWLAEHRAVETGPHPAAAQPFADHWRPERVVSSSWVKEHLGDRGVLFVDARAPSLYEGAGGHLPGAHNVFWMTALDTAAGGVLRPMRALRADPWKPAGAEARGLTVVTYCQTGMQASFDYFVARYLGYPDVRLYDGSMSEWTLLGGPVERSSP